MGFFNWFKKKKIIPNQQSTPVTAARAPQGVAKIALPSLSPVASPLSKVFLRPLVTEKAARSESHGTYTFVVERRATKGQICQAVRAVYGVAPRAVRLINVEGKRMMFGQRPGKRPEWKKALVTLPKGQTIRIHEGV